MRAGKVEQLGTPLDIYDKPDNVFVASFIGSPAINLIQGTIESGADGAYLKAEHSDISWPLPPGAKTLSGETVQLGVRPEHIRLDPNGLHAEVVFVEPTGADTHVNLRVGGKTMTAVFRERVDVKPGEVIRIAADVELMHLFESESGKRVLN